MEFEVLKDVIVDVLKVDRSEITVGTTFIEDLGADSLDVFQILMELEDKLKLTFDSSEVEKVVTVGDAVDLIANTKGE